MEICALTVLCSKDGKESILKASDCTFSLIGDSQEEDRRMIADIVSARMQVKFITYFKARMSLFIYLFRMSAALHFRNLNRDLQLTHALEAPSKKIPWY